MLKLARLLALALVALTSAACGANGAPTTEVGNPFMSTYEIFHMEMEDSFDQQMKLFRKQQELADRLIAENDSLESSYALKRLSNLHTAIAAKRFAIKQKLTDNVAKMAETAFGQHSDEEENKAMLLAARALLRSKVAYLQATGSEWKQLHKLIERYESETDNLKYLVERIYLHTLGDSLSLTNEQQTYEQVSQSSGLTASEMEQLESQLDEIIDEHFGGAGLAKPDWANVTPLASDKTVDEWVREYIPAELLKAIEQSDKEVAGHVTEAAADELAATDLATVEQARKAHLKALHVDDEVDPNYI